MNKNGSGSALHFLTMLLLGTFSLSSLVGCQTDPLERRPILSAYLHALAELSEVLHQSPLHPTPPSLPRLRSRIHDLPSPRLSARLLLTLRDCPLGGLIAHRNSPLGRVMTSSQRALYEARFLDAAPRCLVEGALGEQLASVVKEKRTRWSALIWNAVWGSRALGQALSLAGPRNRPPPLDPAQLASFARLAALFEPPSDEERAAGHGYETLLVPLEESLSQLPRAVGAHLSEGELLTVVLQRAAELVSRLPCSQRTTELFRAHYLLAVQPILSRSFQALDTLLQSLTPLRQASDGAAPAGAVDYLRLTIDREHPQGLWQRGLQASRAHSASWRALWRRCPAAEPAELRAAERRR